MSMMPESTQEQYPPEDEDYILSQMQRIREDKELIEDRTRRGRRQVGARRQNWEQEGRIGGAGE